MLLIFFRGHDDDTSFENKRPGTSVSCIIRILNLLYNIYITYIRGRLMPRAHLTHAARINRETTAAAHTRPKVYMEE